MLSRADQYWQNKRMLSARSVEIVECPIEVQVSFTYFGSEHATFDCTDFDNEMRL